MSHCNTSAWITSNTTYVVCFNLIHVWRNLQFNVESERKFLKTFFMAILFTIRVFALNLQRRSRQRNIFVIFNFVVCWLIRCKARVASQQNHKTKHEKKISSAIFSQ